MKVSEVKNLDVNSLNKKTVKKQSAHFSGHNFSTLNAPTFFHETKTSHKNSINSKKSFWKNPSAIISIALLSLIGASEIYKIIKKNRLSVGDITYKKTLLASMGINPKKINLLKSIAGKDEFLAFLKGLQGKREQFSVGVNFENAIAGDFAGNMHMHSLHSDGTMSIKTILEQASLYANKYAKKHKKPFFIALTDHNTMTQNIEALKIISGNPKKYKNLRVVLGSEINTVYEGKQVHILAYNVNPFSKNWGTLIDDKLIKLHNEINKAISNANKRFSPILSKYKFQFSFDDMAKIRPTIVHSPCDVNYPMKDYMQFRLIYADLVENNKPLQTFLESNGIKLSDLNFATPKFNIPARNVKQPYWVNYVEELQKYLKKKVGGEKANELKKVFKPVSEDVKKVLTELETATVDEKSSLFVSRVQYENIDTILNIFEKEPNTIIGYAHPCLLSEKGKMCADTPQTRSIISTIFDKIAGRNKIKDKISESYYQAYYNDNEMHSFKQFTEELAQKHGFLHSGSYDSHKNNIFTNNTHISPNKLKEILTPQYPDKISGDELFDYVPIWLSELTESCL